MNNPLKQSLEELDAHLNSVNLTNPANQEHLDELREAVRGSLQPGDTTHHDSLRERLEKAAFVFDAEHPALSSALRSAVDILAEAGF
jgi:hypothetical protein